MTVRSADYLKSRFEAGDTPTQQDFVDLIDSILLADQTNFPNPLPAVGAQNLTNLPKPDATNIDIGEYNEVVQSPSYLDPKSFSVAGNLVGKFPPNLRVRLKLSPNPLATTVVSSAYNTAANSTTVTVLDPMPNTTISEVAISLIAPLASGGAVNAQGVGFTHDLQALTAEALLNPPTTHYSFDVEGATTITGIAQRPAGATVRLYFKGAPLLRHSAGLQLLGGTDYQAKAGDVLEFEALNTGWRQVGAASAPEVDSVGAILHFARATPPQGWLKANGAIVSRTTYAKLFAAIGTVFGEGDKSTTFALPDLRGEFVRSWTDDEATIDPGRAFGSKQPDEFKSHTHAQTFSQNTQAATTAWGGSGVLNQTLQTGATGGRETRPRNIALLACIRFA